jgi:hypothetical protein
MDSSLRRSQRRVLLAMAAVVLLTPLVLLGGAWQLAVIPALAAAVAALAESVRMRRVRRILGSDARTP